MTRAEHITAWKKFVNRLENKYTPKLKRAIRAQFDAYFRTRNIEAVNSAGIYIVLEELRKEAATNWGDRMRREIKQQIKNRKPMGFSRAIYELMSDYFGIGLLNDAQGITEITREYIRLALDRGALKGLSFDDIVAEMTENVPELSAMRARRIARTETVASANKASVTVAKASGVALRKKWLSVHDKRTRHDHALVDGQTVELDQAFLVGGYELMHPGDRGGNGRPEVPGKETIQCRCTVAFEAKRDANGRLVRQ